MCGAALHMAAARPAWERLPRPTAETDPFAQQLSGRAEMLLSH